MGSPEQKYIIDVNVKAGVSDPSPFYGFSSVFVDLNNDGKVDLAVADGSTPNYLYINNVGLQP